MNNIVLPIALIFCYVMACWVLPLMFLNDYASEVLGTHIGVALAAFGGYLAGKHIKEIK